jgi:hypothetical protein
MASCTGSAIRTRFRAAPARADPEGRIVTLDRQDLGPQDRREMAEGVRVIATSPNLTSSFVRTCRWRILVRHAPEYLACRREARLSGAGSCRPER